MQSVTTLNNVLTVSGTKVCKFCGAAFRWVSINGGQPFLIDAVDDNGLGPRLVQHTCGQDSKALRSTISRARQIIGRPTRCKYCHASVRNVYLIAHDEWQLIDDPGDDGPNTPPLTAHGCHEYRQAKHADKRAGEPND